MIQEIEKAHHDVFNILLQILEDGRLTDGQGRVVNFRNTVVILTSNIGSHYFQGERDSKGKVRDQVLQELRAHLRPELMNRIDEIIVFNKLNQGDIGKIVDLQLKELETKLSERKIGLRVDREAREKLAAEGYDSEFGARPLRRLIQREIQDPLAVRILSGEYRDGAQAVVGVDKKSGTFQFLKE